MRQLGLLSIRRTSRLLTITLVTVAIMAGAGDLKRKPNENIYLSPVTIEPDEPNRYTLNVQEPGKLTFEIPAGVKVTPQKNCAPLLVIKRGTPVDLVGGCTIRFTLDPSTATLPVLITATEPVEGQPGEAPRLEISLLPSQSIFDRVVAGVLSAYGVGLLLLAAAAGLGIFLWRKKPWDGRDSELKRVNQGPSGAPLRSHSDAPIPRTGAAPPPPAAPVQYASRSDLETLNRSVQNLDTNFKNLAEAQRRSHSELVAELSRFVERCQKAAEDAVQRTSNSAFRAAEEVTDQNEKICSRLLALETALTTLHSESRKGLSNLLQALPREALTGLAGAQAGSDLAQKLEQAVARYLREEQPDAQSLASYAQQVGALRSAIMHFKQIASESAAGQADSRLDPLDQDLDLIAQELAGFTRQGTDRRFRLLFAVDFSAHESARQTLTESIAAGLQREIVKLDSFDDYYSKRIGMLAAQVAAECADLADSVLDPQRAKPDVKSALQSVFAVAGVEEIAPRRNDPFLGTDHTMFQMIRRTSAVERSGAVAQTISRGLRQRDRIVRKATVTLFE